MIRSFADKDTERLFNDEFVKGFSAFERPARPQAFVAAYRIIAR